MLRRPRIDSIEAGRCERRDSCGQRRRYDDGQEAGYPRCEVDRGRCQHRVAMLALGADPAPGRFDFISMARPFGSGDGAGVFPTRADVARAVMAA